MSTFYFIYTISPVEDVASSSKACQIKIKIETETEFFSLFNK